MDNFWKQLSKPILVLAPMEDVTDTVFRQMVASCAPPDVFFTEFVSVEGFTSVGRKRVEQSLLYTKKERPIVAQIWGLDPKKYYTVAQELVERGFDGVDINMGCPIRKVVKKGACAALIKNPSLAQEIIAATKEGAGELPVSVKTRIGYNSIATEDWIGFLLKQHLDTLIIHGRTAKEMSAIPANWDEIGRAVKMRDELKVQTLIIGNGDVKNREEGLVKVKQYGVDGVMIGRGIFQNLWAFDPVRDVRDASHMLDLMLKHCELFCDTWGERKSFLTLRKFFKIYISGFEGASQWRDRFMKTKSIGEVEDLANKLKSIFIQV